MDEGAEQEPETAVDADQAVTCVDASVRTLRPWKRKLDTHGVSYIGQLLAIWERRFRSETI